MPGDKLGDCYRILLGLGGKIKPKVNKEEQLSISVEADIEHPGVRGRGLSDMRQVFLGEAAVCR